MNRSLALVQAGHRPRQPAVHRPRSTKSLCLLALVAGLVLAGGGWQTAVAQEGADPTEAARRVRELDDETLVAWYVDCLDECGVLLEEIVKRGDATLDALTRELAASTSEYGQPANQDARAEREAEYRQDYDAQATYAAEQDDSSLLPSDSDTYVEYREDAQRWDRVLSVVDALRAIDNPEAIPFLMEARQVALDEGRTDVATPIKDAIDQLEATQELQAQASKRPGMRNPALATVAVIMVVAVGAVFVSAIIQSRRGGPDGPEIREPPEPAPSDAKSPGNTVEEYEDEVHIGGVKLKRKIWSEESEDDHPPKGDVTDRPHSEDDRTELGQDV